MSSILSPNQSLGINQSLISGNGQFQLIMQSDGKLVIYRLANHHALWATGTNGQDVMRGIMQGDGNLVLYTFAGRAVWSSRTNGRPGSFLIMQDDGKLVIYQPNVSIWVR
jgi:hypothetical protein